MPLFLKYFIDEIIANRNLSHLLYFSIALIVFYFIKLIATNLEGYFQYVFKEKTFISLQQYVFSESLKIKYLFFENNNTGYIVSRIHNELLTLQGLFGDFFVRIFMEILIFCVGIFFIFTFSTKLSIIALSILPFFAFNIVFFTKKIKEKTKISQEEYGKVYGFFYEYIEMIFLVKTLILESFAERGLKKSLRSLFVVKLDRTLWSNLFSSLTAFIGGIAPVVILYFGGKEVITGSITLGTLIAFNSFLAFVFGPAKNVLNHGSSLASCFSSFERISEVLNLEQDKKSGVDINQLDKIEFRNVSFGYENNNVILKDINFALNRNESLGIFGKIGSGKSTIIKLLIGLYGNYSGEIVINGINAKKIGNIFSKVGILPQDNFLFSTSVEENIRLGDITKAEQDIQNIVERFKLKKLMRDSSGEKRILKYGGVGLSGGEKQKIVAARLVYRNPELVIIDEGTSNLDAESEDIIHQEVFRVFRDKMIIVISHRFNNIVRCDNILYLKEGQIVDCAPHHVLRKRYDEYEQLFLSQKKGYI